MKERLKGTTCLKGNALSKKRNQGTQRIMSQIKVHQQVTGFKVKVQFIPTWERGRSYTWQSSNWDSSASKVPVARSDETDSETESDNKLDEDTDTGDREHATGTPESEELIDSQEMSEKPEAHPGTSEEAKKLRVICDKCFQCKGSTEDPYPKGIWVRCGYTGCSKLHAHAKCMSLSLSSAMNRIAILKYCKDFIRCDEHMGKVKPSAVDIFAEDSNNELASDDSDFLEFNYRLKNRPTRAQVNNKPQKKVKSKPNVIGNKNVLIQSKNIDQPEQSKSGKHLKYVPSGPRITCSDEEFND